MSHFIFGIHSVEATIKNSADQILRLFVKKGSARLDALVAEAKREGVAVMFVDAKKLDAMSEGENHQGIIAELQNQPKEVVYDLEAILNASNCPLVLVLDGVTDPHNLGACLRSADAFGADCVIVPKDRAAGLTPVVRKVASGAAEVVPFIQVTNLARTLNDLKQRGIWLVGLAGEVDCPMTTMDFTLPTALVLGSEGEGLRRLTRETCDYLVNIPMQGSVGSLNVSVAAGVSLFEVRRQRNFSVAKSG